MTEASASAAAGADTGAAAAAGADKGAAAATAAAAGADKGAAAATIVDGGAAAAGAAAAADAGGDKGAGKAAADGAAAAGATTDWRDRLAGGDKDFRKQLERFADEGAFAKSYRALQTKLSSGEMKRALPEGATAEEVATWRKENGIPDKPEGYVEALALPQGVVIGDADKPIVAKFAEAAHAGNVDPKAFSGLVAQYYAMQDEQRAQQAEADAAYHEQSMTELQELWPGAEFKANKTAIGNLMAGWPEGLAANFLAARMPDGRLVGDNPAMIRQLAQLSRELNPAATLVPAGTGDPAKGVADRIAEIKGWMGAKQGSPEHKKYWKDPKVQDEYRSLLDAQSKMKARSA